MKETLQHIWEQTINLGVSHTSIRDEIKKVRIVNSLCVIGIVSYGLWVIYYAFDGIGITALEAAVPISFLVIVIATNYYGRFSFARYFLYISTVLTYVYYGVAHGAKDGAEYLLFITCIMGLMFFEKFKVLALLFVFNLSAFWFIKYTHTIMSPIVLSGHALYGPNIISTFTLLFAIAYYFKIENKRQESLLSKQNENLAKEKEKSEQLLLNILPEEVAEELKRTGKNIPRHFEMATVIFTDFKEFTSISQVMTPTELVREINVYFTAFDRIIQKYNIEKIKTIGDAYLCVGGVPVPNDTNPVDAVKAAIEFQEFMKNRKIERMNSGEPLFDLRIGIHTGPVVAGVVGKSKFAYDIWGDTVNTASRLETTCEIGRINISQFTYEHIKEHFKVEYRGKVEAKHKGQIDMYYIGGERLNFN